MTVQIFKTPEIQEFLKLASGMTQEGETHEPRRLFTESCLTYSKQLKT